MAVDKTAIQTNLVKHLLGEDKSRISPLSRVTNIIAFLNAKSENSETCRKTINWWTDEFDNLVSVLEDCELQDGL